MTIVDSEFNAVACFHSGEYVSSAAWDASGSRLVGGWDRTIVRIDDVPVRVRVQAREARREGIAQVESKVGDLCGRLGKPEQAAEALRADASLSPLQRRVALQLLFARSLGTVAGDEVE